MATLCPTACVPPKPVTGNACGGGAVGAAATTEAVVAVGTAVAGTVVAVAAWGYWSAQPGPVCRLVAPAYWSVAPGCRSAPGCWSVGPVCWSVAPRYWPAVVAGRRDRVLVGGTGVEVGGTGVLTVKTGMIGVMLGVPGLWDDHGGGLRGATGRRGDGGGVEHRFRTNAHLDPNVEGDGRSDTDRTGIQGDRIEHGIVGAPGVRDAAKEGLTRSQRITGRDGGSRATDVGDGHDVVNVLAVDRMHRVPEGHRTDRRGQVRLGTLGDRADNTRFPPGLG